MKPLPSKLILFLLLLCTCSKAAMAQSGADAWVKVSPSSEQFTVLMPQNPEEKAQQYSYGDLNVDARVYRAVDADVTYTIWSLKNNSYQKAQPYDVESYLDDCAELVWESFLKPLRTEDPERRYDLEQMVYQTELKRSALPGREYSIRLKKTMGLTHIYVSGERIYVLMVLGATRNDAGALRFLQSFAIGKGDEAIQADATDRANIAQGRQSNTGGGDAVGYGPGRGGDIRDPAAPSSVVNTPLDYNRVFTTREVTQKARILSRSEPAYTESARKFGVQGTIVIRAVFSKEGDVRGIKVVKGLPHGLTQMAVMATRQIRFTPASIDGRPVSQYIQIEYNFNLY